MSATCDALLDREVKTLHNNLATEVQKGIASIYASLVCSKNYIVVACDEGTA